MEMQRISDAGVTPGGLEFAELAKKGNLVPVYREVFADTITPVSAFLRLGERPSYLLESVVGGEKWARYSFLGLSPKTMIRAWGDRMEISGQGGDVRTFEASDPLEKVREFLGAFRPALPEGSTLPRFYGGFVGYLGYDMVRFMEELPGKGRPGLDMPDLFLMLTGAILIFDNLRQKVKIVVNVHLPEDGSPEEAYEGAVKKIDSIASRLVSGKPAGDMVRMEGDLGLSGAAGAGGAQASFVSSFGAREEFMHAVDQAKQYVMAGDVVQVVLSQRFQKATPAHPFSVYRALRAINPSPYMYYIDTGDAHIVGSSPEILVRLEEDRVTLRPIAGTRKRGKTPEEDQALEKELLADRKEIAEHIMLVDLGRNDVGRVSETGTVKVPELMVVERYSHVMHIVSNVEGRLREGLGPFDVLRACFPAGTVSGAPKVRAMEIIDELEPVKRGPYAGAVGYLGYSGNMDTCITIRTLIMKEGMVYVQAGAGIVADSVPEFEYAETVNKAKAMMEAVDMAERVFGFSGEGPAQEDKKTVRKGGKI